MKVLVCSALLIALLMNAGPVLAAEPAENKPDRLFGWMLGGYVAMQMTDVYLTKRGTNMGMTETNPVFGSGDSVVAAKTALVPLTAWGLVRLHRRHPRLATGVAIGLNAIYLSVARNNMRVINAAD